MTNEELLAMVEPERIDALARENENLRAQIARLREALEPFAEAAKHWEDPLGSITHDNVNVQLWQRGKLVDYLTCGDLRKAKAVLAESSVQSQEAVRAKEYAMREALQFVIDCGSEDVEWSGASTKESAIEVCRRALEATPEQSASRLEAVRAEARRQTLADLATLVPGIDEGPLDKGSILTRLSGWLEKANKADLDTLRAEAVAELQQALESDRINVIEGVNCLTKEIESRAWLATGARSSYEWDDSRYQQEFRDAAGAILEALEPLKKIGADLSNCPADAKRSLERMRAEAGREAIEKKTWEIENGTSYHPENCPVTGRPFFMTIEDESGKMVATYGGPFDSYTIPEWNAEDDEFRSERYDHDAGTWVDGGEPYAIILRDEQEWLRLKTLEDEQTAIRAEAGRERAVRELAELANKCRHVAHLPNMGHEAVIPTRFLRERLEEIAKEGK